MMKHQLVIVPADAGAIAVAGGLEAAAGGEGAEHLDEHVAGQGVAHHHVGGPLKHIVAPHHGAAVGPDGLGKADGIARLLQLAQRRLAGPCAIHVEDAHGGLLNPAGLSGDEA